MNDTDSFAALREIEKWGARHAWSLAVLQPLQKLARVPAETKLLVIDSLDELVMESRDSESIVTLLANSLREFPSWLRLICTSRYDTTTTKSLPPSMTVC